MKQYKIINTDIQLKGKLFPEGSTISLDDKDAEHLSDYLVISDNVILSPSKDKVSAQNNKELIPKNNKRSK